MNQTRATSRNHDGKTGRRRFLRLTGAGMGLLLGGAACGAQTQRILKSGDRIDIGGDAKEIIERAYALGHQYEARYGGCAQCTVAALQDAIPFVPTDKGLFRGASGLDGGATPTGVQNCGGFTGSAMVIGYLCGRSREKTFTGDTGFSHKLVRKGYEHFKKEYGSVLCKDVRKGAKSDCPKVVGLAARWTAEVLLSEFGEGTFSGGQNRADTP